MIPMVYVVMHHDCESPGHIIGVFESLGDAEAERARAPQRFITLAPLHRAE